MDFQNLKQVLEHFFDPMYQEENHAISQRENMSMEFQFFPFPFWYPMQQTIINNNNCHHTGIESDNQNVIHKKNKDEKSPILYILGASTILFASGYIVSKDGYLVNYISGINHIMRGIKKNHGATEVVSSYKRWHTMYMSRAIRSIVAKSVMIISCFAAITGSCTDRKSIMYGGICVAILSGFSLFMNSLLGSFNYKRETDKYRKFRNEVDKL